MRFFQLPLTWCSTGRSFSRNQNISARGRIDEGFEAIAFGDPFSTTIRFVAVPRLSGHRQSEDPGPAVHKRHASFGSALDEPLTTQKIRVKNDSTLPLSFEEAPRGGALRAGEEEMS